jgi:hypothetical protein
VTGSEAWYVYGVVPAAAIGELGDERALTEGEVAALVRVVPLAEFGEEPLRANLNDREWLERTAREHEEVVGRALAAGPVLPFRLGTIYRSDGHVRDLLRERGASFAESLRGLEGKVELGVKAWFDRARFLESAAAGRDPTVGELGSGRRYLLRRRLERQLAEEADAFKAEVAEESHERLGAVAEDAKANPPQAPELSGRAEEMLLNGAYLVRRDERRLPAVVAELETRYGVQGVSYELTGPWAPYNFVPNELLEP